VARVCPAFAASMTNIKHDEHNGFDVLGSDICMCRPYPRHGIEVCARKKTDSVSDAARNCQS
jgi:GTP cyclohydrolase II